MIPIGGLLLVIIAEPPNRIELLNRRLLHTSRDGEEHLACDQHRLCCSDRHSGARATWGKSGGRTGVEVSGTPDSAVLAAPRASLDHLVGAAEQHGLSASAKKSSGNSDSWLRHGPAFDRNRATIHRSAGACR